MRSALIASVLIAQSAPGQTGAFRAGLAPGDGGPNLIVSEILAAKREVLACGVHQSPSWSTPDARGNDVQEILGSSLDGGGVAAGIFRWLA